MRKIPFLFIFLVLVLSCVTPPDQKKIMNQELQGTLSLQSVEENLYKVVFDKPFPAAYVGATLMVRFQEGKESSGMGAQIQSGRTEFMLKSGAEITVSEKTQITIFVDTNGDHNNNSGESMQTISHVTLASLKEGIPFTLIMNDGGNGGVQTDKKSSSSQSAQPDSPGVDLTGITAKAIVFIDKDDKHQFSGSYGTFIYFYHDGSYNYARLNLESADEVNRPGMNSYMTFSFFSHIHEGYFNTKPGTAGVHSFVRNQGGMVQAQFIQIIDKSLINTQSIIEWEGQSFDLTRLLEYHDISSDDVVLIFGKNRNGFPGITAYSKTWGYLGSRGYRSTDGTEPYTLVFYDQEKQDLDLGRQVVVRHAKTDEPIEGVEIQINDIPMGHTNEKGEVSLPALISGELSGSAGLTRMALSQNKTTTVKTLPLKYKSPLIKTQEKGKNVYYQVVLDEVRYGEAARLSGSEERDIDGTTYKGSLAYFTTEDQYNLIKEEIVANSDYVSTSYWIGMDIRKDNTPIWSETGQPIWDTYSEGYAWKKDTTYSNHDMTHGYLSAGRWSTMTDTDSHKAGYVIRWDR